MPQPLPRAFRLQQEALDLAKVEKIVSQVEKLEASSSEGATAAGDERRLRGLPAIGRGSRGAIAGTVPGQRLA